MRLCRACSGGGGLRGLGLRLGIVRMWNWGIGEMREGMDLGWARTLDGCVGLCDFGLLCSLCCLGGSVSVGWGGLARSAFLGAAWGGLAGHLGWHCREERGRGGGFFGGAVVGVVWEAINWGAIGLATGGSAASAFEIVPLRERCSSIEVSLTCTRGFN